MPALMKLVKNKNIYVIEDNCDGWGSSINRKKIGSFGHVSITSFHAAHIVSMGVGGGIFTNDKSISNKIRMYRDWGRQANTNQPNKYKSLPDDYNPRFIYEKIGYNFQILELQAAMGRVQLRKADKIKKARKHNFDYLYKHLSEFPLMMPESVEDADVCWFAFPLSYSGNRGKLVAHLEKYGIETRSMFSGQILAHPAYAHLKEGKDYRKVGKLEGAEHILRHSFWISVHPRLTTADLDYIVKTFHDFFA
jgi:CDP-6-deoxy-D-xylo-4-hexulose-3-dehydrase